MNPKDLNHEWLDVEDIIWNILDSNQSSWGHNFKVCRAKINALVKAKNLTSLFEGTNAAKELEEIIDMKINCIVKDYFTPLKDRIKSYAEEGNVRRAIILLEHALKNLDEDTDIFPQRNLIYSELLEWKNRISARKSELPEMRMGQLNNQVN
jgi:hypothetical protein